MFRKNIVIFNVIINQLSYSVKMKNNNVHISFISVFVSFFFFSLLVSSCSEIDPTEEGGCLIVGFSEDETTFVSDLLSGNCNAEAKVWSVSNVSQTGSARNEEITTNWDGFKLKLKAENIDGKSALYYEAELPEGVSNPTDANIVRVWPAKGYIMVDEINIEERKFTIKRRKEDKSEDDVFSNATITVSEDKRSVTVAFAIDVPAASSARSLGVANGQWTFTFGS